MSISFGKIYVLESADLPKDLAILIQLLVLLPVLVPDTVKKKLRTIDGIGACHRYDNIHARYLQVKPVTSEKKGIGAGYWCLTPLRLACDLLHPGRSCP
mgnify:CR=1 FL=1